MAARLIGRRRRPIAGLLVIVVVGLVAAAGCGGSEPPASGDPGPATAAPIGPATTVSPNVAPTRAAIDGALARAGIGLSDTRRAFRPIEAPELAGVPRSIVQAVLPTDPEHGFIVVYELPDPNQAMTAAKTQADYLASGPGRIQAPSGTRHIIRVVGPTLVFYSWHPDASTDAAEPSIQTALETVGIEVPIPG